MLTVISKPADYNQTLRMPYAKDDDPICEITTRYTCFISAD
ncbi:hypothetical protein BACCELL_02780 [Bacteroides cellulosilyticus DSM 14838]|uniref:Uncharacterized protein n=1 Tax=Bacteroides cellulosilyticus DSM 14838 TaxID=537012 RepID=E2NER2_9BACE|nr:hypothetical protein BACCELL_02780 [Bacteroides cellulosilyticus DSM 14838]